MSDQGAVIRDPVQVGADPIVCRSCKDGHLGKIEDGKSSCVKCGRLHGFLRIKGEVRYGVCL